MGDGEKAALHWFLQAQRDSVLAIVEGLDEKALTTPVLASGWTPLGMIEHLGFAERYWFQQVATGSAEPLPWSNDDPPLVTSRSPGQVFAFYREQCARSDAVLAATPLATPPLGRHRDVPDEEITDLRRVVLHMIEETARHAGHLDVVRELIDGKTGLGPR
ncbi:DinB family protein [Dactylosporangium darangshiense]|uniref:DinB family protein n=1 Tax=Dactylosporangium darangshiense TaxID=579108 RepID=A0ABP8DPN2_9ACTN